MPEPDDELSPLAKTYRSAGPWLQATGRLTGGVLVGVLVGVAVDKWKGWEQPWGLLGCSVLGLVVGFYGFIKGVMQMGKKGA